MKKIILKIIIIVFAICTIFFTFAWLKRYKLPYNDAGKYFDDVVVLDQDTVLVLAMLSIGSFIVTGVLCLLHSRVNEHVT